MLLFTKDNYYSFDWSASKSICEEKQPSITANSPVFLFFVALHSLIDISMNFNVFVSYHTTHICVWYSDTLSIWTKKQQQHLVLCSKNKKELKFFVVARFIFNSCSRNEAKRKTTHICECTLGWIDSCKLCWIFVPITYFVQNDPKNTIGSKFLEPCYIGWATGSFFISCFPDWSIKNIWLVFFFLGALDWVRAHQTRGKLDHTNIQNPISIFKPAFNR